MMDYYQDLLHDYDDADNDDDFYCCWWCLGSEKLAGGVGREEDNEA